MRSRRIRRGEGCPTISARKDAARKERMSVQGNNKVWHKKGKERSAQQSLGRSMLAFLMGVLWYGGYTRPGKFLVGEKSSSKRAEVFSCL